jgi:hypothetical protein
MCAQEAGFTCVHAGKQSVCTRRTKFVCDARMVACVVVITCSEWITCTIMLCAQYACVHSCIVLLPVVISCVRRGKFVWCDPAWGRVRYFKYFCADQCYRVESVH